MKKFFTSLICLVLALTLSACAKTSTSTQKSGLHIVTTNFPAYDFARAIVSNQGSVTMLLKPGQESHDYDPTPQDIIRIEKADIFVYTGGESDTWVKKVLKSIHNDTLITIRMMDYVSLYKEKTIEGMQDHHDHDHNHNHGHADEYDEHIWTDPKNVIKIISNMETIFTKADSNNKQHYQENAKQYQDKLTKLDLEFQSTVSKGSRKVILFGDRFPFRYFVESYKLNYYAAFSGCSIESDADAKTIAFLVDKVRKERIPVVFHIELSKDDIATTISKETGAKVLLFHSVHNISKDDFKANKTYIDFMKQNVVNLKEALQ